jgi:hypothetical protein
MATGLVWDSDVNLEGLALGFESDAGYRPGLNGFLTAGVFPLQEVEFFSEDKYLYGFQAGLHYARGTAWFARLAAGYYDYRHVEGVPNDPLRPNEKDYTAPKFQQKGNTLIDLDPAAGSFKAGLASDYDLLDVAGVLDLGYFHPLRVVLTADYVKNIGFDRNKVRLRTGNPAVEENTQGVYGSLLAGQPKILGRGDWNVSLAYEYLESDAALDAFTDSDFHLGGTNAQGWILAGEYGLSDNFWLGSRWISTDEIDGPQLAVDTWQLDLNASY